MIGIGVPQIRQFIAHLQELKAWQKHPTIKPRSRGLAGHSISTYLRAIRAFWTWLESEEIVVTNPFPRVKFPRPPLKVVPTFGEEQLRSLFATLDRTSMLGIRDWAMLLLFLDTGIRVSELVNIDRDAVDLAQGTLKVCGKGSPGKSGTPGHQGAAGTVEIYPPVPPPAGSKHQPAVS